MVYEIHLKAIYYLEECAMKKRLIFIFFLFPFLFSCNDSRGVSGNDAGKIGFIDKTGRYIIKPQYDWIQGFKGNVAAVEGSKTPRSDDNSEVSVVNRFGAIDIHGALIVPLEYDTVRAIGDGFIMAHNDSGWALFDETGKRLCPDTLEGQPGDAGDGLVHYSTYSDDDRSEEGFLDKNCNKVLKFEYYKGDFAEGSKRVRPSGERFGNGLLWADDDNGKLLINTKGEEAARFKSEGVAIYRTMPFSEGLSAVATGYRDSEKEGVIFTNWGYADTKGALIIPGQYDEAHDFSEGLACVKKGGLYGFIDAAGREVIAPQYDDADMDGFRDGLCAVFTGGKDLRCYFIDRQGKRIFDAEFEEAYGFHEGLAAVKVNGKWGYIDRTGAFVIKPVYSGAGSFSCGLAAVSK